MNPGAKWATFDWEDPFLIDDQLSEEEGMARDTARSYAQNLLQHRVVDAYRNESTDTAIFREMGELGIKCKQRLKMAAKALHNPSFAASFCVSTRVLVRPIGLVKVVSNLSSISYGYRRTGALPNENINLLAINRGLNDYLSDGC